MGVTFQNILLQLFKTLSVITKLHKFNKILSELYSTPSASPVAREMELIQLCISHLTIIFIDFSVRSGVLLPCRVWWRDGNRERENIHGIRIVSKFISKIKYQANFWKFLVEFLEDYLY